MNLSKMLTQLRADRDFIEEAILALERLLAGSGPRRGRPPSWLKALKRRGRPRKNPPVAAGASLRQRVTERVDAA